jgi:hypothetical protein
VVRDGASGGIPEGVILGPDAAPTYQWDTGAAGSDALLGGVKRACSGYCTSTADCPQGAVACANKRCIYCTSDAQCVQYGGAQKCDVASGSCVMCEQDSHCSYYGQKLWTGKCDLTYKMCVKCSSDADCAWQGSPAPKCVNSVCVQCTSDADCAGQSVTGCDVASGFCYKCKSDAECCPPGTTCGLTCDLPTGACLCTSDQQCKDTAGEGNWECLPLP